MTLVTGAPAFSDAEAVFRRWSGAIAKTLMPAGERPGRKLDLSLIKSNHRARSYRAESAGRSGFLKLFDKHSRVGREAYTRERDALLLLHGRELVPRHLAHCDQDFFILSEMIEVQPRPDLPADRHACVSLARGCGGWLAEYEAAAPVRRHSGNWFDYLTNYDRYSHLLPLAQMQSWLADIPLCGSILSRCDNSLGNFMIRPDGSLAGCDFEQARFKPRGWDFAMTYQAFAVRWPLYHEEALAALAAGFSSRHRGVLDIEELTRVARALFILEADTAIARG